MNPADNASRVLNANKNTSSPNWFSWPVERTEAINDEDPEVKHLLIVNRITENHGMLSYLAYTISG